MHHIFLYGVQISNTFRILKELTMENSFILYITFCFQSNFTILIVFQVCFALVMSCQTMLPPVESSEICKDPTTKQLMRKMNKLEKRYNKTLDFRLIYFGEDTEDFHHNNFRHSLEEKIERTDLPGDKDCPSKPENGIYSSQRSRSTCPWSSYIQTDYNRFPRDIIQAECRCDSCLSKTSQKSGCEEVYYYMNVLRRVRCNRKTKLYIYKPDIVRVAVGCACAAQRTAIVS